MYNYYVDSNNTFLLPQKKGFRLSAMHIACIQGREDVVKLLIASAAKNMQETALEDILNAKTKVSYYSIVFLFYLIHCTYTTGPLDASHVCC